MNAPVIDAVATPAVAVAQPIASAQDEAMAADLLTFRIGMGVVAAVLLVMTIVGAVVASRVLPRNGPLRGGGMVPALLSGVVWALGNIALLRSTSIVGVAAGFTFSQLGFVIATLGSIFLLKEPRTRREIAVVLAGIAAALAGVVLMGMASAR